MKYPLPKEIYEHYKGGTYEIITLATHTETGEKLVVYKSLNFGSIYVRPLDIFMGEITNPVGVKLPRFMKKNIFFN